MKSPPTLGQLLDLDAALTTARLANAEAWDRAGEHVLSGLFNRDQVPFVVIDGEGDSDGIRRGELRLVR